MSPISGYDLPWIDRNALRYVQNSRWRCYCLKTQLKVAKTALVCVQAMIDHHTHFLWNVLTNVKINDALTTVITQYSKGDVTRSVICTFRHGTISEMDAVSQKFRISISSTRNFTYLMLLRILYKSTSDGKSRARFFLSGNILSRSSRRSSCWSSLWWLCFYNNKLELNLVWPLSEIELVQRLRRVFVSFTGHESCLRIYL